MQSNTSKSRLSPFPKKSNGSPTMMSKLMSKESLTRKIASNYTNGGFPSPSLETAYNKTVFAMMYITQKVLVKLLSA
jgi:hypothetical protein